MSTSMNMNKPNFLLEVPHMGKKYIHIFIMWTHTYCGNLLLLLPPSRKRCFFICKEILIIWNFAAQIPKIQNIWPVRSIKLYIINHIYWSKQHYTARKILKKHGCWLWDWVKCKMWIIGNNTVTAIPLFQ